MDIVTPVNIPPTYEATADILRLTYPNQGFLKPPSTLKRYATRKMHEPGKNST
jgi:hypothetical protein